MEDLEGFLMEEGYGSLELESSFSSSLDAWWNGQISELDCCDLDLFSLLEEGDLAHQQHLSSLGSMYQDEQQQQQEQLLEEEDEHQQQVEEGGRFPESDCFDSELLSFLEEDGSTLQPTSSFGSINQIEQQQLLPQLQQQSNDDEEEEEEESEGDDKKGNAPNSKNLVSERNRRKRLNQQLFTLRSLVPNITKMDKRSILVDALAYLQRILEEIDEEKENANVGSIDSSCVDSTPLMEEEIPPMQPQEYALSNDPPAISQIEVEIIDEERFALKIGCNRAMGALSQVQRVIESLGVEITCNSINQMDHGHMFTTAFLRVKKKGVFTEEKLKNRAKTLAKKLGLLLLLPNPSIL